MTNDLEKTAVKVSIVTIIVNAALSVFKLFAGIFGHSYALISDAIHSASDVFSTVIVLIGVKGGCLASPFGRAFLDRKFGWRYRRTMRS